VQIQEAIKAGVMHEFVGYAHGNVGDVQDLRRV
jgi:hypothetical protein